MCEFREIFLAAEPSSREEKNFLKKFPRTCSQAIISFLSKTSEKTFSKKQLHPTSEELNFSGETIEGKTSEGLSFFSRWSSFIRF